jgi:hypothetical protein
MTKQHKNTKKALSRPKIKELAGQFDDELKKHVKLTVLKNGAIGYKDFIIKKNKHQDWCIHHIRNISDAIGEFKLKTCAVLAAKAYSLTSIQKYYEIKELDTQYWANHINNLVYKNIITQPVDLDRYIIILNKLEDSEVKADHLKRKITTMFHASFA